MDIIRFIHVLILNFFLKSKKSEKKERNPISLQKAKKIGILFNAENIVANEKILLFAQKLKSGLREVQLLGYIPKREFGYVYHFPFITNKDTNWYGKPGGRNISHIINSRFELIINFSTKECIPFEYLIANTPSKFRVGFNPDSNISNYDLILITKENGDITRQIKNLEEYLK